MRVRAGVAPRVASGDPAGAKGKSAGGASFGKRRVERERGEAMYFCERVSGLIGRQWYRVIEVPCIVIY